MCGSPDKAIFENTFQPITPESTHRNVQCCLECSLLHFGYPGITTNGGVSNVKTAAKAGLISALKVLANLGESV